MAEEKTKNEEEFGIMGIFPTPVYVSKRKSNIDSTEEKEIEDIIKEGLGKDDDLDYHTNNTYIFDTKLKNLKEFCEKHIKIYVKEILNPKQELDFYITQSWLNVIEPGGNIHRHWHSNSIISGAFYIQTDSGQTITCYDKHKYKQIIRIESKPTNPWNFDTFIFDVTDNDLFLFPSWIDHGVEPNEEQTKDVISLSFNTFVRGTLGSNEGLTELIL